MATAEQEDRVANIPPSIKLRAVPWLQLIAISILGFALNFHWSAIGIIILPSQVVKMVGDDMKGEVLAAIVTPGAFVSLFANPLFGMLSDQTRGWLARWGKRRPYIIGGTALNVIALIWMALARDVLSLGIAYCLLQFSSNAIQAPFHALLPDIVPSEQRGKASGFIGLLAVLGNIGGVIVAGRFGLVDARRPLDAYQQGILIAYGIIIAVLVLFMFITILSVNEEVGLSAQMAQYEKEHPADNNNAPHEKTTITEVVEPATSEAPARATIPAELAEITEPTSHERHARTTVPEEHPEHSRWLTRSFVTTLIGTLIAVGVCWALMALWNMYHFGGIIIDGSVQQVVLEIIGTLGLMRLFQFDPRKFPDFSWVLVTRLVMMMGIYIIQTFLQYYLRDVVRVKDPEGQAANFVIVVALTSLVSSLIAGWLSDSMGRKRLIYISGGLMATVGGVFILVHDLPLVIAAGAIFGLGYGAYGTVDWALVADVLPSHKTYARDMGVWNVSLSLPQVIAPLIGGPLIDTFGQKGQAVLGFQILFALAIVFCLAGTVTVRNIKGVAK